MATRLRSALASGLFTGLSLCLAALLAVAVAGCGGDDGATAQKIEIKEPRLVTMAESGERSFSGVLVNNNATSLSIVQVEVALYNGSSTRIGTTNIEVEDVPANGEKKFSGALDTDATVAKARVRSVMVP